MGHFSIAGNPSPFIPKIQGKKKVVFWRYNSSSSLTHFRVHLQSLSFLWATPPLPPSSKCHYRPDPNMSCFGFILLLCLLNGRTRNKTLKPLQSSRNRNEQTWARVRSSCKQSNHGAIEIQDPDSCSSSESPRTLGTGWSRTRALHHQSAALEAIYIPNREEVLQMGSFSR